MSICCIIKTTATMEIGARIRQMRCARELGQAQLAMHLGVRQGTLSKVERGVLRPTMELLMRLAQLFGIPPGDLLIPLPPIAPGSPAHPLAVPPTNTGPPDRMPALKARAVCPSCRSRLPEAPTLPSA